MCGCLLSTSRSTEHRAKDSFLSHGDDEQDFHDSSSPCICESPTALSVMDVVGLGKLDHSLSLPVHLPSCLD